MKKIGNIALKGFRHQGCHTLTDNWKINHIWFIKWNQSKGPGNVMALPFGLLMGKTSL